MREIKIKNTAWISLVHPLKEEIQELAARFPDIHPLVLEEISTPTIRQRVENYENHLFMVLYFPSFQEVEGKTIAHEVDFILLENALVTVQYGESDVLEDLWRECEEDGTHEQYGKTPIHLLSHIIKQFLSFLLKELDEIEERIDTIEHEIFSGREKEMLESISILKRNILDFRRAIKPQHFTLRSLILPALQLYGSKLKPHLTDLVGEQLKVWNLLKNQEETLDTLYETNNSLLTAKTNNIILAFTVIAFITFIPTAIANIYGMNISYFPLAEGENAFWRILGLMAVVTGLVYMILKQKQLV
jgi:magnesium transporter